MKIPPIKIYFSEQDRKEILQRVDEALSTGQLAMGKNVREFEERFATYVGTKHAVAVSSGSSALEIAMRVLEVRDKEVLVPTNTFLATAAGVLLAGGRVRLVDIAPDTFSVSLKTLRQRITEGTIGVIVVHIGGIITPEIEAIRAWCDANGLWLLEDAAHAHGSTWNGKRAGTFGLAGAYSFFATKVMTSGEGGMIVTDDDEFARKARLLRNHGKPEPWVSYHTDLGSNWRMSEMNAVVGLVHLRRLDEFIAWRERIANLYTQVLRDVPEVTPVLPQSRSSWYKYIILLEEDVDKAKLKSLMKEKGVSLSGEVYDIPLHQQPVLKGLVDGDFPVADDACRRHICLPLYYGMSDEEARFVVDTLRETIKRIKEGASK